MTSSRPYMIRALHAWIVDNGLTPHLVVNAEAAAVQVPRDFVDGGKVVLNVSPTATSGLHLGNERIEFRARFSGRPYQVVLPPDSVLAMYARENGVGMAFQDEGPEGEPPSQGPRDGSAPRPRLRVVK